MAEQNEQNTQQLSQEELQNEQAADMPNREAMTLLDLDANLDLALDLAAPIDAAVAANANVAVPVDASVAANVIGIGSTAASSADQDSIIMQNLDGEANATATQTATIDQGDNMADAPQ
jgi:hypothetical protein